MKDDRNSMMRRWLAVALAAAAMSAFQPAPERPVEARAVPSARVVGP